MPVKSVRFDYFRPHIPANPPETKEQLIDISPLLQHAKSIPLQDTCLSVYGEDARFQTIVAPSVGTRWEIELLRIRRNIVPGIADDAGGYTPLQLSDDQGLGESVSCLYDSSNNIFMLQRNKNSLSPTAVSKYLSACANSPIILKPLILPEDYHALTQNQCYRSIEISFSNDIEVDSDNTPRSIWQILKGLQAFSATNSTIRLSLGHTRQPDRSMNPDEILGAIKLFRHDKRVSKLTLGMKDNEESPVEYLDLIEEKIHDIHPFRYDRNQLILHNRIYPEMELLYNEKIHLINKIINI